MAPFSSAQNVHLEYKEDKTEENKIYYGLLFLEFAVLFSISKPLENES